MAAPAIDATAPTFCIWPPSLRADAEKLVSPFCACFRPLVKAADSSDSMARSAPTIALTLLRP